MAAADHSTEPTDTTPGDPPPLAPREGDDVGVYRLLKMLGTGGMGTVFLAEHHTIGRKVAIKFLLPELVRYPDIVGRFFDEARSVNRINHENIVEIFDFVRSPSGISYLVMEFLEGTDLYQTRKRDGPYPLGRTLVVCEQIAAALTDAHKAGIVHRDLKPENAFLIKKRNNRDFVKLLDFGLAKLSDDLPIARLPTQAGIVMGTPGYMSPEQAHGAHVDGRSDVFSLGILLHWMLMDKVPDGGADSEAPERNVEGEEVPDQLRALLTHCIKHEPAQRPASMGEVLEILTDLRRQVRGTEVLTVMPRHASRELPPLPTEAHDGERPVLKPGEAQVPRRAQAHLWRFGAAALALVAFGLGGLILQRRPRSAARVHPTQREKPAQTTDDRANAAVMPPPTELPRLQPPPGDASLDAEPLDATGAAPADPQVPRWRAGGSAQGNPPHHKQKHHLAPPPSKPTP